MGVQDAGGFQHLGQLHYSRWRLLAKREFRTSETPAQENLNDS